ncbi:ThiF family adenylyltransferase [Flavonifractor sp. AGMB03687]|uniref:ThiF family adenylyltransferase n=1 Tax=Flavonifractor sp. AGMB03687 TaxID=2785133 RepID=UPI001ADF466B|nr:ThiF family adenylyltransferase [Flavonifractor sp. AGMB03687]
MDNIAFEILSAYEELDVEPSVSTEDVIVFRLEEMRFAFLCPKKDSITSCAHIFALDVETFDQPHILLNEIDFEGNSTLPKGKYRSVCLYESGSIINALVSYEEKIVDAIERLLALLSLSPLQKEKEFQKEFLFYWNNAAQNGKRDIYLDNDTAFSILSVYQSKDRVRYIAPNVCLSDLDATRNGNRVWQQRVDIAAIFLPIIDNRGILPPRNNHPWGKEQILEIVCSDTTNHISRDTFLQLRLGQTKYDTLDIVFGMTITKTPYTFLARIKFHGGNQNSMLERLIHNIHSVEMLQSEEIDYRHLNQVIGNSTGNLSKKVLLIGAGSLGSYVASELVKNGFKDLTIYDGDALSPENFMRWYCSGIFKNGKKASLLGFYLEMMHPEIHVDTHDENIDAAKLIKEMPTADYIIFTVGSSDTQLRLNRVLKENGCKAKVLFAWLEAGGQHSHLLRVDYSTSGCFECLFTDNVGNMVNNQANITADEDIELNTIRNGCGATRVAYGTSVLLRTTSALLDILHKEEFENVQGNYLVNISPNSVAYDYASFTKEACRCCGN